MVRKPSLRRVRGWGRSGALALLAFVAGATSVTAQLSVDELEVFLTPGSRTAGAVRVTNDSDRAVQVVVSMSDWDRDSLGVNRFYDPGTLPQSCGARLRAFPTSFQLAPRSTDVVRVTLEGAETEGCWGIVFIQTYEPTPPVQQSQLTYTVRTGVKVYVEPTGALQEGDVDDVRLEPQDTTGVRKVAVWFANRGAAHLRTRGVMEIRRPDNSVAASVKVDEFPSVPGALRKLLLPLPRLPAGTYIVLVMLDYGGDAIAAGQVELIIP